MQKNRKIKNFFIYPQFQTKLILLISLISLVAPLLIFAFQTYSFQLQIKNGQMLNLSENHPYFVFYNEFQDKALYAFFISVGVSSVISFLIGLVVSHRIAGPLVKMKKHFEATAQNPESDKALHFRDGDFFKELADSYNLKFNHKKV